MCCVLPLPRRVFVFNSHTPRFYACKKQVPAITGTCLLTSSFPPSPWTIQAAFSAGARQPDIYPPVAVLSSRRQLALRESTPGPLTPAPPQARGKPSCELALQNFTPAYSASSFCAPAGTRWWMWALTARRGRRLLARAQRGGALRRVEPGLSFLASAAGGGWFLWRDARALWPGRAPSWRGIGRRQAYGVCGAAAAL